MIGCSKSVGDRSNIAVRIFTLNLVAGVAARPSNETARRLLPAAENMPVVTRTNGGSSGACECSQSRDCKEPKKYMNLTRDPGIGPRLMGVLMLYHMKFRQGATTGKRKIHKAGKCGGQC